MARNEPSERFPPVIGTILAVGLILPSIPSIAKGEHLLTLERQIGFGWSPDKYSWMSFVSFSPDGKMVASDGPAAANDNSSSLTFWRFSDGQLIKGVPVHPMAISPDWRYYASDHGVAELETGKLVIELGQHASAGFAFSPDSHYVAESVSGSAKAAAIRVIELPSGKQVSSFGKLGPLGLAISPDSTTLASGYWDIVTLWNMLSGDRVAVLRGAGRYVGGLSFSHDGRLLAATTDAGGIQLWDVHRRASKWSINIEGGAVSDPVFSPDDRYLAVGIYATGTAWLIDVSTGKVADSAKVSDLGCGSVAFSPDGRTLITPSTGGLIKWPYDLGGTIRVFRVSNP
jgi:WD40 repeat protein